MNFAPLSPSILTPYPLLHIPNPVVQLYELDEPYKPNESRLPELLTLDSGLAPTIHTIANSRQLSALSFWISDVSIRLISTVCAVSVS